LSQTKKRSEPFKRRQAILVCQGRSTYICLRILRLSAGTRTQLGGSRITADLYLGRLGSCNTRIYVKYEAYIDRDKNSLTRYGKMHVGYENNIYRS
jgi:hypothetical protein